MTTELKVTTIYVQYVTAADIELRDHTDSGEPFVNIAVSPVGLFVPSLDEAIAVGERIAREARRLKAERAQAEAVTL